VASCPFDTALGSSILLAISKSCKFIPSSKVVWELGWGVAHIAEARRGWDVESTSQPLPASAGKRRVIWSAMMTACCEFCVPIIARDGVERYKYWEDHVPPDLSLYSEWGLENAVVNPLRK